MWVRIRSHLWRQCETWVWFLTPTWKWICKSQNPAETPTIISTTSGESENSWARNPRARLYMHLLQARLTTATVWSMDYLTISSRNSSVCKHSCQTSSQSEEIWLHNSRTRYASLASSQIPDWIQNTVDRLQRTSWPGTSLHPRNDHPIKKQRIFHKIQRRTCPEGSKIQAWYFWQACIRSVWTSGMELLAKGN